MKQKQQPQQQQKGTPGKVWSPSPSQTEFPWFPLLNAMWAFPNSAALGLWFLCGVETPYSQSGALCIRYRSGWGLLNLLQGASLFLKLLPLSPVSMCFLQCSLDRMCPISCTSPGLTSWLHSILTVNLVSGWEKGPTASGYAVAFLGSLNKKFLKKKPPYP